MNRKLRADSHPPVPNRPWPPVTPPKQTKSFGCLVMGKAVAFLPILSVFSPIRILSDSRSSQLPGNRVIPESLLQDLLANKIPDQSGALFGSLHLTLVSFSRGATLSRRQTSAISGRQQLPNRLSQGTGEQELMNRRQEGSRLGNRLRASFLAGT